MSPLQLSVQLLNAVTFTHSASEHHQNGINPLHTCDCSPGVTVMCRYRRRRPRRVDTENTPSGNTFYVSLLCWQMFLKSIARNGSYTIRQNAIAMDKCLKFSSSLLKMSYQTCPTMSLSLSASCEISQNTHLKK